ncbi:MAG TPA: methyltransferase domain-containing protein [Gaiellaceae bacterium]|nr:methyltransferase domain-containing protein [Gaiellaceae bacterium]
MRTPDFSARAAVYDRLRPYDANWQEVAATLIREADLAGRRVLDIGCGTGRFLAQLDEVAKAWGVDASPEMLEVARSRVGGAGLKLGTAEELPFKDGWFERATMWLVAHLVDRPRAFAEAARVLEPGGRFAVVTFDPSYFEWFWLNELFPSMEAIDQARFPTADELTAELAEFADVGLTRLSQTGSLVRDDAIERIRGKHISTFDLISAEEYEAGLARAARELPERVDYRVEWLVAVAR